VLGWRPPADDPVDSPRRKGEYDVERGALGFVDVSRASRELVNLLPRDGDSEDEREVEEDVPSPVRLRRSGHGEGLRGFIFSRCLGGCVDCRPA
jgi:hypothetical protein